jgi:hypothetical protein
VVVYNTNPKDTQPIVIVTKWSSDPLGGPARKESTYMIKPGEGIDLSLLGLEPIKRREDK